MSLNINAYLSCLRMLVVSPSFHSKAQVVEVAKKQLFTTIQALPFPG